MVDSPTRRRRLAPAAALGLLLLPGGIAPAAAFSQGPDPDRVNLCSARLSCNNLMCHDSYPADLGSAVSTLALSTGPLPLTWRKDEILDLVLSVVDPDPTRQRFGFQIGVVSGCPFAAQAGSFALTDPGRTQIKVGGGLSFVEHACTVPGSPPMCGYLPVPIPGQNSWDFTWQAPAAFVGPVSFYWAINAADGNGLADNDFISFGVATLDPDCPAAVARLLAVKRDCDAASPGIPELELSWDPAPYANGYRIYRSTDPTLLADPGTLGATPVPAACDSPPAGPPVHFYTVVGVCGDSSDGPA